MPKPIKSSLTFASWTLFVIFLDQLSKKTALYYWPKILLCNQNLAMSLPYFPWLFWPSWIFFVFFLFQLAKKNSTVPLFIVLGGGISNLFDRLIHNCVFDWIHLGNFPVFNLADVAISAGIAYFLLNNLWKNYLSSKKPSIN